MPGLDFQLGEMADTIRDTTRRFAMDKIEPIAASIDEEDRFPVELWPQMGELGLHGITVSEEDGGLGLGYLEHVVAQEEIARASASVGLSYGAHTNLCINQIAKWASPEQKAKYLPGLISGEHVGSLAMSEAGAGSDVVSMKLKAEKVDGGYKLNGTKFWITNATHADTLVVYAKTGEGSRGITTFLIEKGDAGFSIGQKIDKVGMRGSPTAELVFDDCIIPEDRVMGPLNGGVGVLMSGLDYERTVLSGIQLGIMQACLDVVLPYVRERKQFGQSIGNFQLIQAKVADMYVALNSARAYVYTVAKNCDAGKTTRFDAAGAILLASESAFKVAGEAVQALGGAGYTKDWPVERYMRDAKLLDIGAGTNEIRRMLIGRELVGAGGRGASPMHST
ncbi:acyl-CoA dehydrogenase family protein [Sphingomicrobium flavum]|uniref:acyl-CoA dehydrogenase family protein n=1 Tax=Sphingomicrobium flavum TaxID=1229164 RepID=UPI0021AE1752|nr:acyl-CoA dehydrogenase family protein [Sphingomicrobium flavum]